VGLRWSRLKGVWAGRAFQGGGAGENDGRDGWGKGGGGLRSGDCVPKLGERNALGLKG